MSQNEEVEETAAQPTPQTGRRWIAFFGGNPDMIHPRERDERESDGGRPKKWSMGVLNDTRTHEVPGSVLLLSGARNEPLGLKNAPARTTTSTLPQPPPLPANTDPESQQNSDTSGGTGGKKKTKNGDIILEPQPHESSNDPLNWPTWRRDAALLSLGLFCLLGGGMTPILAAGFTNIEAQFNISAPQVALTTGLFMMGLGVGSVFASPTAILYGKRPVYLCGAVLFILSAVWCAESKSFISLLIGRIFQGIAVSPVECLPSATIAEIYFLHERAFRIGIYTLLLLSGKNLVPLVSAAIIQSLGWRWVFWVVALVVGLCLVLLFFFVPETFWDRTPGPKSHNSARSSRQTSFLSHRVKDSRRSSWFIPAAGDGPADERRNSISSQKSAKRELSRPPHRSLHIGFAPEDVIETPAVIVPEKSEHDTSSGSEYFSELPNVESAQPIQRIEKSDSAYLNRDRLSPSTEKPRAPGNLAATNSGALIGLEKPDRPKPAHYTAVLANAPRRSFISELRPCNGRLHQDNWLRVAIRPFILYCYPAVLWSSVVYACSIGWLIVLSESVSTIYRSKDTYNFSALSAGLIYISPFVGGVLGTAVAGKVSDFIVRAMSRRNGGLYEPEFRLVMAIPVAVTTGIGLMGYGWSAQNHDKWIVPTIFFGIISFGCSLGSTTAITFCVDSYRQYAGEALVTLNFAKNIAHGLVFSLFFNSWLNKDGSRTVFIALGVIQVGMLVFTIPMYIFGKRARMWTVRRNLMEKF